MFRKWLACFLMCVLSLLTTVPRTFAQSIELTSATMGTPGRVGGNSISEIQWIGWRFQTDVPLAVHHIGGHLLEYSDKPGNLFGAFIQLASISSLPNGAPFSDDELVAYTTFDPGFPSNEYITPMDATLLPGAYMLLFGTGMFGATGEGAAPNGFDHVDIPPTDLSSFVYWSRPGAGEPLVWRQNLGSHMRYIIQADVIHLPGDYNLNGEVGPEDYDVWRSTYGASGDQNADGNDDQVVDAADYTIWRDNLGNSIPGGAGNTMAAPEPTALCLLLTEILLASARFLNRSRRHTFCTFSRI